MLFVALTIKNRKIISRLAQFLVEFDSGIEQRARSATKKDGCEKPCGRLNQLTLIVGRAIIENTVCVKEILKIVEFDDPLFIGTGRKPYSSINIMKNVRGRNINVENFEHKEMNNSHSVCLYFRAD